MGVGGWPLCWGSPGVGAAWRQGVVAVGGVTESWEGRLISRWGTARPWGEGTQCGEARQAPEVAEWGLGPAAGTRLGRGCGGHTLLLKLSSLWGGGSLRKSGREISATDPAASRPGPLCHSRGSPATLWQQRGCGEGRQPRAPSPGKRSEAGLCPGREHSQGTLGGGASSPETTRPGSAPGPRDTDLGLSSRTACVGQQQGHVTHGRTQNSLQGFDGQAGVQGDIGQGGGGPVPGWFSASKGQSGA